MLRGEGSFTRQKSAFGLLVLQQNSRFPQEDQQTSQAPSIESDRHNGAGRLPVVPVQIAETSTQRHDAPT